MHRRKEIEYIIKLPKELRIDSLDANTIHLDENYMVTIREKHHNVAEMKLKDARRKFG